MSCEPCGLLSVTNQVKCMHPKVHLMYVLSGLHCVVDIGVGPAAGVHVRAAAGLSVTLPGKQQDNDLVPRRAGCQGARWHEHLH
jgi:hypothetical protein